MATCQRGGGAHTPTTKAANKPAPATPRPTPRRPSDRAAATQAVAERRPQATTPTRQTRSTTRTRTAAPVRATAPENTTATRPDTMVPDVRETADAPRGQPVDGWAAATLTAANGHARAVYEAMVDHLWAPTALAMCGDGVARGLGEVAIGMQRVRHQLPRWQPYSVQEMLKLLGKTVHVLDAQPVSAHNRHGTTTLCLKQENGAAIAVPDRMVDEYYLVRGPALPELPPHVMGYRFVLGARLREAPCDMNGGRQASYYELVPDAAGATVGVYIPEAMTHYAANKAKRASHRTQRYTPVPRSQQQPQQTGEDTDAVATMSGKRDGWLTRHVGMAKETDGMEADDEADDNGPSSDDGYADMDANISHEATQALADLRARPLNMQGRSLTSTEAAEICPRNWFLFNRKPPHISQLAWNVVRPDTRTHHLRWLARIKSMPNESMKMSLPSACIDLILSTARVRKWKWATTAKAFAAVAGALRDLPPYSTQPRGIRLQDDPEWRGAFGATQRYMKESVPNVPPHMTEEEVRQAIARLTRGHPRAALFLAMMSGFAARACDIATRRAKDVTMFPESDTPVAPVPGTTASTEGPRVKITLTMRRGKGAKTRGPYPVPSVLSRELAATLQGLMVQTRGSGEIFAPHADKIRSLIATELRKAKPGAQLPSVRKGALRCMADAGVPTRDLLTISGHTKQGTLLRYLGYGQQPTAEAEAARVGASHALFPTR